MRTINLTSFSSIITLLFIPGLLISCKKQISPGQADDPTLELTYNSSPVPLNGIEAKFSANISYADHFRAVFDIFIPESNAPTPLVIFIHGGGFVNGDKSAAYSGYPDDIRDYLQNKIAFATINYRFKTDDTLKAVYASLEDVKRCLQFIRYYAASFNIDKAKIASFGGSAGAGSSIWLAFHDDMADPSSSDPVLKESTRLKAVGWLNGQGSYDPLVMNTFFTPINFDMFTLPGFGESIVDEYNIDSIAQLSTDPALIALRNDMNMIGWMSVDDPEFYAFNENPYTVPQERGEAIHHPLQAKALLDKATAIGLANVTYITSLNIADPSGETLPGFMKRKLR